MKRDTSSRPFIYVRDSFATLFKRFCYKQMGRLDAGVVVALRKNLR